MMAASAPAPSVLGISTRYCAPSGKRFVLLGSSWRSPEGSPILVRKRRVLSINASLLVITLWVLFTSPGLAHNIRLRCGSIVFGVGMPQHKRTTHTALLSR